MGKKKETISLIDTFSEFNELKNIDKATLISVLEEAFRNVISKTNGTDENYDIIINPDKGDLEIWRNRVIVEDDELEDPNLEITLSEAVKIDADFEVGEEVTDEVSLDHFGRRTILNLRQTLASKILELEKDNLFNTYKEKVGEIVSGEVYQVWKKELLLLDDEHNELILPKTEQIPSDFFRKGEHVRAVVARVENKNNNPRIILSRTSPVFLERLFEQDIPEIADGLITIKGIARIPGERAKVAVEAYDDRIDPVGACVGMKGFRIHGIVRELRNENIDVINFTNNTTLFIQRSLSPARINSITVKEEEHRAEVFLNPEEVSLAIGKGGANIKLASMLTGYNIEVFRDIDEVDEEDIYLDEFRDEIDGWVIDQLKKIGCSTAKNVLQTSRERIIREADLEESTVDEVLAILRFEFEDEEEVDEVGETEVPEETIEADAAAGIEEALETGEVEEPGETEETTEIEETTGSEESARIEEAVETEETDEAQEVTETEETGEAQEVAETEEIEEVQEIAETEGIEEARNTEGGNETEEEEL